MIAESLPPGLLLLLTAPLLAVLAERPRRILLLLVPLLALAVAWTVPQGVALSVPFLAYEVALLRGSMEARWFATVLLLCMIWLGLAGPKLARRELVAAYCGAGFALGVVYSGDLIAVFLQWDMMVLAMTALIWCAGGAVARAAGVRFLVLQLLAGFLFKLGMDGAYAANGSYRLMTMTLDAPLIWALLVACLVKAAAWPVSAWLPDAFGAASRGASAWLALMLPATGLFMLIMLFTGTSVLFWAGAVMVVYGLVYAALQHSRDRLLCHALVAWAGVVICALALDAGTLALALAMLQLAVFAALFTGVARSPDTAGVPLLRWSARPPADADWLWRVLAFRLASATVETLAIARERLEALVMSRLGIAGDWLIRWTGPEGVLARTWGIGLTSLLVGIVLVIYVLVYLF
jgi:multicomponent Na+:H+ antiporter subunit D